MSIDQIQDPEVRTLAALATSLEEDYISEKDPWQGSPFRWIQSRPSRQKGAIGELLVAGWAASKGFDVLRSDNSDCDRIINGLRIEIKYSNLWANTGGYKFQQIRDQAYDYCFCLGLSPFDAQAWFIPKHILMDGFPDGLTPQHGGQDGRDTRWLSFIAKQPPSWLAEYGGRLGQVKQLIIEAGHGKFHGHKDRHRLR
ncbi:hypothetical protein [Pseudoclavibacter sp. CFCC 11306]|uniref:hypothetical protein n=1 Tax=Pseudoclavibacter sp. CFCC 11306 TaxID=1564493 RepID=UPI001300CD5A|nr:hypothetical protein [Pseudoclavibacter sp. CFCC 11306]KAB1657706.1 hypothetical protein F8O09_08825 [Pseudoclavibacter sp. CFCC 11306]